MKNKNYLRGLGKSYDVKIVEREKQCYGFTMESLGTATAANITYSRCIQANAYITRHKLPLKVPIFLLDNS